MILARSAPLLFCLVSLVSTLAVTLPVQAQDGAELLLRLDRLETENRRLNGQVEQLQFQTRKLDEQLKKFQSDVDFRFKESGGKPAGSIAPGPATPAPARQQRGDALDSSPHPSAAGGPRTIGSVINETTPGAGKAVAASTAGTGGPVPLDQTARANGAMPVNAAPGTAKGDFDLAKGFLDRGDLDLAEASFREFQRSHSKDKLVPDALFYVGETYYRRSRYREAAEQYLSVTTQYGKASRAPEAMLKLGMSLRGLGATAEACGTYSEVTRKYPNAAAGVKQAVDRERKRAQCSS